MDAPTTTFLYAGIFGVMAIALAVPAGTARGSKGISIGDGGDPDLLLAMRRHGNFVEWVPIALIVLAMLEASGVASTAIHALGGGLLLARILHAVGLKADTIQSLPRGIGAGATVLILAIASIWLIVRSLQA